MNVAVIGGGPSGLMAAYFAAINGNNVTLYDKNEKCGKKIYITGKGRCNLTNLVEPPEFFQNVVSNSKFLTTAIYSFTPNDVFNFFENGGMPCKVERGNRVFPVSDKASDVTKCLENYCKNAGVKFVFNTEILNLLINNSTMSGIITKNGIVEYDKVIVCTGGKSYKSTGSSGDGYKFAKTVGHEIIEPRQALCSFNVLNDYIKPLQGLSLKNVSLSVFFSDKQIKSFFGEMMFTHFGVSGPIVLTASSYVNRLDLGKTKFYLDLKPALTEEQLDVRILRDFENYKNKNVTNALKDLLPNALIPVILNRSGIDFNKKVNCITKQERKSLLTNIKRFDILISSLRDFSEAIVTSGGVNVKQINPKTMESKLIKGLYFCGEVLDVDALTGGFNMQIAFSTGYLAGNSVGEKI